MSYTIKKSDGTTLATVPENDIVLDAASVALIGRGATNYGAAHSQAFVQLLENFANVTPPAHPLTGQLWYDSTLGALKVFKNNAWELVGSGGGGGGGGGTGDAVGGPIYVSVVTGGVTTSVIAMVAGGKVVAAIASRDIPNADLPLNITVLNTVMPFRDRFPGGLEGGINIAYDNSDYILKGHVRDSDRAEFAGGGTPFGATTYCDLGSATVTLSISNGQIIAAFSQVVRAQTSLPSNFTINGITMPFASVFPNGLVAGLTIASGYGINSSNINVGSGGGSVTTEVVAEMISEEATARASAISTLYAYADANFAEAGLVNTLNATFLSSTGQTSLSSAIEWLVATAGSGTANAQYAVDLKAEITNAITGATSFAHALTLINAQATEEYATASDLTALNSEVRNDQFNILTNALNRLSTNAIGVPKVSVDTVSTVNITLSGEQTINGVTTSASRVLVARQTNKAQNGIYITGSGAWVRAEDMNTWNEAINGFVMVNNGSYLGIAWLFSGASTGTLGTTPLEVEQVDINSAVSRSLTELNSTFEATTGYTSFAEAVNDLKTVTNEDGSTSRLDTDLRTRFTNVIAESAADASINTIDEALAKFKDNSISWKTNKEDFDSLVGALKTLVGSGVNDSVANAVEKLYTNSNLDGAIAQKTSQLETKFVEDMNELTGGTGVTFASAINDVIYSSQSNGDGSTSSAETNIRNIFVQQLNETAFPVTSIAEGISKLMNNTTKDRSLSTSITNLENIFTTGLGTSIAQASTKLFNSATAWNTTSSNLTTLTNKLMNESGKGTAVEAYDYLVTAATSTTTTATKVTSLSTAFTNMSGETDITKAVQTLFSRSSNMIGDTNFASKWGMAPTSSRVARNNAGGYSYGDAPYFINWVMPTIGSHANAEINNYGEAIPVVPGTRYYFSLSVQTNSTNAPAGYAPYVGVRFANASGDNLAIDVVPEQTVYFKLSDLTVGAAPKKISGSAVAPPGAVKVRLIFDLPPAAGAPTATLRFEQPTISTVASSNQVGWGIELNNNGYITGLESLNGGVDQSSFKVAADKFIVSDPNDASPQTPMFEVVNGAAYIKGEKIQTGTVSSVKVSTTNYGIHTQYGGGVSMPTWQPSNEVVFPPNSVPNGSQAIITFSMSGDQTGSNDDSYYIEVQRYAYQQPYTATGYDDISGEYYNYEVGGGYGWTTLSGQKATFNILSNNGNSQSYTFVDNGITAAMTPYEVRYKMLKSNRSASGGAVEAASLVVLMSKK